MTLVTSTMLYEEILETKKLLKELLEKDYDNSIEELSLYRASKKLHLGPETVIDLVKRGKLEARTFEDKKTGEIRYRFPVANIRKFQKQGKYSYVPPPEGAFETGVEIADRIFPGRKKKCTR